MCSSCDQYEKDIALCNEIALKAPEYAERLLDLANRLQDRKDADVDGRVEADLGE